MAGGNRIIITLECRECSERNYTTTKNKRTTPGNPPRNRLLFQKVVQEHFQRPPSPSEQPFDALDRDFHRGSDLLPAESFVVSKDNRHTLSRGQSIENFPDRLTTLP